MSKEKGLGYLDVYKLTNRGDGLSNGIWHIDGDSSFSRRSFRSLAFTPSLLDTLNEAYRFTTNSRQSIIIVICKVS